MSDIYIPGVNSRFDTDKMIEGLMKVERVPRDRLDKEVQSLETQKTAWQDIGRRMTSLRENARTLFSFQNPFSERVLSSSDEGVISGSADRTATERDYRVEVIKIATADRFASKATDTDYQVKEGTYTFSVGENNVSISFKGGSLKDFASAVERRGKGLVSASVIQAKQGTSTLILESKRTGASERLGFSDDAEKLAVDIGLVERVDSKERQLSVARSALKPLTGSIDTNLVKSDNGELSVAAGGSVLVPASPSIRASGNLSIQFEISSKRTPVEETKDEGPPQGPSVPATGVLNFAGVSLESDPTVVDMPPWTAPPQPERRDDPEVLSLVFADGSRVKLPPIPDDGDWTKLHYRLADYGKELRGVALDNKNTHRDVSIRSIKVYDPDAAGGVKPLDPISVAGDAELVLDGIKVERPTNSIDDLIPGVTLEAKGATDGEAKVKVEPDRKAAKDAIIAMIGTYNRLMAEVNVLTRTDDTLIQELTYLNDDERDALKKKLGLFQGDITLNQFRTSLQRSLTAPYPSTKDRDLSLLSQIGISSDSRKPGSSTNLDRSRLRGYLEIDEKQLDSALEKKMDAIQELFGRDSDGDLVMDTGAAYAADALLKPYVETGGIIALKTSGLDSRIAQDKTRMGTLDEQLASKESEYKRKYGQMEGALGSMERTSSSLDNFMKQNSN